MVRASVSMLVISAWAEAGTRLAKPVALFNVPTALANKICD